MNKVCLPISILLWLVLLVSVPSWADLKAGKEAYDSGDYETALKEFLPLADQGNAQAQFNLGFLYSHGQGVPQDYQEAARWSRLASEQGNAQAQFDLAVLYSTGKGIPKDYVLAYMWANLVAVQGQKAGLDLRAALEKSMTSNQIAEAQRLSREWKPNSAK